MGENDMTGRELKVLELSEVIFKVPLILAEIPDLLKYVVAQPSETFPRDITVSASLSRNLEYGLPFKDRSYENLHQVPERLGEVRYNGMFNSRGDQTDTLMFALEGFYHQTDRYLFSGMRFDFGLRKFNEIRDSELDLARHVKKHVEIFFIERDIERSRPRRN